MKKKFFFLPLLAALALTGCSSDEQLPVNPTPDEAGYSDNYMTVAIEMPTATRAGEYEQSTDFEDGTANESNVSNVVFFFFDANNFCVDIQKLDNPRFTMTSQVDPNIENFGTVEVRLKSAIEYKKVAVVLNSTVSDANSLKSSIKNVNDLRARSLDYVANVTQSGTNAGKGQTMSNSVYYNQTNAAVRPAAEDQICLVDITEKNIYTSAERPDFETLVSEGKKEYVDIYVERVAARVDVTEATFNMENYYISVENGTTKKTVTTYNYMNGTTEEITIKPVVKGMCLNVLSPSARLIKHIDENEVGYGTGSSDNNKNFRWNSFTNKRCYWATTDFQSENSMNYFSWDAAEAQGASAFTQYINPNTQEFLPIFQNEGNSLNTKVMVVAELHKYAENGTDEGAIDLVRYGGDYMLSESLLDNVANLANIAVRNIDWESAGLKVGEGEEAQDLTAEQIKVIKSAVSHAFATGMNRSSLDLVMLNPEDNNKPGNADWEAKVINKDFRYELKYNEKVVTKDEETGEETEEIVPTVLAEELATIARAKIDETIADVIKSANAPAILYWKGGKTYFFHNIRHQGFYGLVGAADGTDDFLYAVVRNHIYKISLDGIYGLGTPVIEPGRPIDPDRPQQERPSFIKARINVLKWRVVNNSATIH